MKHINFSSFSTEIGLLTVLNKESKAQVETSEARKQTILNSASGLRPNNGKLKVLVFPRVKVTFLWFRLDICLFSMKVSLAAAWLFLSWDP